MAASNAAAGYGTRFFIKGEGDTYVLVAEVVSVTPPAWSRGTIDVTHLESDGRAKEYIADLLDAGEASITINYIPSATDALLTAFTAGEGDFRIRFSTGTTAMNFSGIVTSYEISDMVADDKMTATFTIKASGTPTLVALP